MGDVERRADAHTPHDRSSRHQELAAGATASAGGAAAAAIATAEPAATEPVEAVRSLSAKPADLEFDLACAVIYHRSCEAWFTSLRRWTMFLTILLGAGSIAPYVPTLLTGVAIAFLGALNLAFDFAGQASRHAELRRSYLGIVTKLQLAGFDAPACTAARRKMLKLAGGAPPTYCAVDLVARNQAILSLGRDETKIELVGWLPRCTRHILRWEGL